ncbi:flagellin Hag [Priestia filamentosa]|uniref:flagellin Hag n=1 Tax=Priestia filamentosa TaxID=1402861 RepID=UPI000A091126|nr:flagellin Hag [Priestia filamentosa]MDT3763929.1 flagellin Hag [Priestia filamentosa]OXS71595.1 flagellin [Priestia filamentosa]WRU94338.1 flagellin Hag [Priestia filamentosa]SMF11130.1 flagellin [Priestia filamentosa]
MRINHNISALNTYNRLSVNNNAMSKNMEKLSSGLRINRAADDAAGLSISEKMRSQIRGLDQASKNAQDGISLLQTAEGGLNETHDILQRMRELVVQAGNTGTQGTDDLSAIQKEITALQDEIGGTTDGTSKGIADRTQFNGKNLLDGTFSAQTFQIGANAVQTISVSIGDMSAKTLGSTDVKIDQIDVTDFTTTDFTKQLDSIDTAIKTVSSERSTIGAVQNRLEHTINNLNTQNENLTSAESRIRDVDMAKEMMAQTKNSILSQASQAMLTQANQQPQNVLQMLR